MRLDIVVWLGPEDDVSSSHVYAKLADLGVQANECDADGRRWLRVTGVVDEEELASIVETIRAPIPFA